jgi:phosphohistidine phosphatase
LNLEGSLETLDLLRPDTDLIAVQSMLATRSEQNLMIVGHNPSLSQLISLLLLGDPQTSICDLKKGGIAALESIPAPDVRYQLAWLAPPRLFRRLDSVISF